MAKDRTKAVDGFLKKMHQLKGVDKGNPGEEAAFAVCESLYQKYGGLLYHSFEYKVHNNVKGNMKRSPEGTLYVERLGSTTELDILYINKRRIFPIEVKAYSAKEIILTDGTIEGCYKVDKSPIHQNEMHCRHLYEDIFKVIPNGETPYIVPIVCFVDTATIKDRRSDWQKKYIKVLTLNTLYEFIEDCWNTELYYDIDLVQMSKQLNEIQINCKKKLPLREV